MILWTVIGEPGVTGADVRPNAATSSVLEHAMIQHRNSAEKCA